MSKELEVKASIEDNAGNSYDLIKRANIFFWKVIWLLVWRRGWGGGSLKNDKLSDIKLAMRRRVGRPDCFLKCFRIVVITSRGDDPIANKNMWDWNRDSTQTNKLFLIQGKSKKETMLYSYWLGNNK